MSATLERFRRPEYTGENRCWPCTVVNAGLLFFAVIALTAVGQFVLAAGLGIAGVSAIALRGYLIPYTPQFAPRLAALLSIDPFHDESSGSLADPGSSDGERVVTALLEAGVVSADGEELYLDPDFRSAWREEVIALRERELDELAAVANDVTPAAIAARPSANPSDDYVVLENEDGGLTTLHRPIAVAELAAARALEPLVDDEWVRAAAGRPLRTLLEFCPVCDGDLTVTTDTCCGGLASPRSLPPEKLVCTDCGARLFTFDAEE